MSEQVKLIDIYIRLNAIFAVILKKKTNLYKIHKIICTNHYKDLLLHQNLHQIHAQQAQIHPILSQEWQATIVKIKMNVDMTFSPGVLLNSSFF